MIENTTNSDVDVIPRNVISNKISLICSEFYLSNEGLYILQYLIYLKYIKN